MKDSLFKHLLEYFVTVERCYLLTATFLLYELQDLRPSNPAYAFTQYLILELVDTFGNTQVTFDLLDLTDPTRLYFLPLY